MRKSFVTVLCVIIGCVIAGIGMAVLIYSSINRFDPQTIETISFSDDHTFINGISVDSVDISGMTLEQAKSALNKAHVLADESLRLELIYDDYSIALEYPDFKITYNTDEVLESALKLGHEGTKDERDAEIARVAQNGVELSTQKEYALDDIGSALTQIADIVYLEPVDAQCRFDVNAPGRYIYTQEQSGRAANLDALEIELNARLSEQRFDQAVTIPVSELAPMITVDQLSKRNVMISTYTSSFSDKSLSGENRSYNINRAAEAINGASVMPGEEFDMNALLGPRTYELGWKGANGITDGKYEVQAGGGVCQTSSTLYNAVMMADLEVTERTPHSWPLSYVPIGRDATISTDGPNFRFRNNRDTPIYVVSYTNMEEKTVTAEIWGEPLLDGVMIKLDSKKVETLPRPNTRTEIDPSLGAGKRRVEREARTGSRAETYKEYYDKEGNLLRREMYVTSTYRSIEGIVYVSAVPTQEQQMAEIPVSEPVPFPVLNPQSTS